MISKITKQIPNMFTMGNLCCGVLSIILMFDGQLQTAANLIILATVFDFFDGFLARLLKVSGELGKQLDSLADMVTFGVAPSIMLFHLSDGLEFDSMSYLRYAFIILAVFSAYRLGKFNLDTRQTNTFIGVPTPITGISVIAWAYIDSPVKDALFGNAVFFAAYCVFISLLLISEIPMPSLKLKKGPLKNYAHHLFLLAVGLIAMIFTGWLCVPIFYGTYVLSSILINFATKK